MQVSVETLTGLERKVTVSVASEKVEQEVSLRLRNLARKVTLDGFRPGKVPLAIVKNRYSDSVREDVAREMVQSTLYDALKENNLVPAGSPFVEPQQLEAGKDFCYTAVFEVFPEIKVKELTDINLELIQSEITENDVDQMLEKLQKQNINWQPLEESRPIASGDKVVIDFEGLIDEKPFEQGTATDYEVIVGEKKMLPAFEEGLIGKEINESFKLPLTFPADYGHQDLAGKEATFNITIHKIMTGQLPELNDEFLAKFNIKEGGVDALRADIKANMVRELERRVFLINQERIFNALCKVNPIDLPKALVDKEIENLNHEMYHRIFGHEHHDDEKIPTFPREIFEKDAARRVHVGLLVNDYIQLHQLVATKAQVDEMIDKLANAYENPEELRQWYKSNKEQSAEIEALVTERLATEKIAEHANVNYQHLSYEEVMALQKLALEEQEDDTDSSESEGSSEEQADKQVTADNVSCNISKPDHADHTAEALNSAKED